MEVKVDNKTNVPRSKQTLDNANESEDEAEEKEPEVETLVADNQVIFYFQLTLCETIFQQITIFRQVKSQGYFTSARQDTFFEMLCQMISNQSRRKVKAMSQGKDMLHHVSLLQTLTVPITFWYVVILYIKSSLEKNLS